MDGPPDGLGRPADGPLVDGAGRGAGLPADGPPVEGVGRGAGRAADPEGAGFDPDVFGLRGAGAGLGRGLGLGRAGGAEGDLPDEPDADGFDPPEPLREELELDERPDEDGRDADPLPDGPAAWIFSLRSAGFASAA